MSANQQEFKRVHLYISGKVQGVFYRASTIDEARSLGLAGWVRNLPDGRVEAVAEGPQDTLEYLIKWCKHGPPAAKVTNVEVEYSSATSEFIGFSARY